MATTILSDLLKQHAVERAEAVQACRRDLVLFEVSVFADVTLWLRTTKRILSQVLFLIGLNPELRIAVVTPTRSEADAIMRDLAKTIRANHVLHHIFPDLVPPEEGGEWWYKTGLTVKRAGKMKDPSVQAVARDTKATGSRIDIVVTSGPTPIGQWYQDEILSRLTENGREIAVLD